MMQAKHRKVDKGGYTVNSNSNIQHVMKYTKNRHCTFDRNMTYCAVFFVSRALRIKHRGVSDFYGYGSLDTPSFTMISTGGSFLFMVSKEIFVWIRRV